MAKDSIDLAKLSNVSSVITGNLKSDGTSSRVVMCLDLFLSLNIIRHAILPACAGFPVFDFANVDLVIRVNSYFSTKKYLPGSRYVKPATGVSKYFLDKYFGFVIRYVNRFEEKFPNLYKVYKVFSVGILDFYKDSKLYFYISSQLRNGRAVRDLSYKELTVYNEIPLDMMRVAPVLILSGFPFANYVVFPIA
ncbi:LETM1 domain-containing protein 1 [Nymphon striatum]|nr:LETM1 domain-containing protein 1 [Nymphon striatum]